ncbi:hypothetical protein R1flu_011042 [Riccia fluitans]|uniref:Uncharacterized protein n=1 Tax=Riccia fluitans TaxID=41844 RepID=A0ABD1Z6Q2_9MARC
MWCPTPKPKVTARPKPVFTYEYHRRRKSAESEFRDDDVQHDENEKKQQRQHDPRRHKRHFGVRHTDVSRMFLVDYHKCPGQVQCAQPHGLKKTDITRYLEKVVPSHATVQPNTNSNNNVQQSQSTPRNTNNTNNVQAHHQKKETLSEPRRTQPSRPPSRCDTRERRIKRQSSRENSRRETAPTASARIRKDSVSWRTYRRLGHVSQALFQK